jgi:hypothetical protein
MHHAPAALYPQGKGTPGTHCTGGWVGPRASLDAEARRKILCLCLGSNPCLPVRSQSLNCLSYRGSTLRHEYPPKFCFLSYELHVRPACSNLLELLTLTTRDELNKLCDFLHFCFISFGSKYFLSIVFRLYINCTICDLRLSQRSRLDIVSSCDALWTCR